MVAKRDIHRSRLVEGDRSGEGILRLKRYAIFHRPCLDIALGEDFGIPWEEMPS
jgi:hypothetical protein